MLLFMSLCNSGTALVLFNSNLPKSILNIWLGQEESMVFVLFSLLTAVCMFKGFLQQNCKLDFITGLNTPVNAIKTLYGKEIKGKITSLFNLHN